MKVIDLLNKMNNGEPIPDKIKLQCVNSITEKNCLYTFNPMAENYWNSKREPLLNATYLATLLDLYVEIIEEPKKTNKIEKLSLHFGTTNDYKEIEMYDRKTINEIIDAIEQLKREME